MSQICIFSVVRSTRLFPLGHSLSISNINNAGRSIEDNGRHLTTNVVLSSQSKENIMSFSCWLDLELTILFYPLNVGGHLDLKALQNQIYHLWYPVVLSVLSRSQMPKKTPFLPDSQILRWTNKGGGNCKKNLLTKSVTKCI